jgi:hypothetical protein
MWAFRCVHPTEQFLLQNTIANKLKIFADRLVQRKNRVPARAERRWRTCWGKLAVKCVDGNRSLAMAVIKGKHDGEQSACSGRCARRRR